MRRKFSAQNFQRYFQIVKAEVRVEPFFRTKHLGHLQSESFKKIDFIYLPFYMLQTNIISSVTFVEAAVDNFLD